VRGGTATMPQMRLNPGTLSTNLVNGALEFDGNELYLTKNGVRNPIGTGATGPAGPQGPVGPQGPAGADGSDADITNGAVIDGQLAFTNNGSFLYPNGAQDGYVWTSDANGLASWQPAMASNVNVNNGTLNNVTVNNSNFDNGDITNSNITDNTINNNVVNGTLTFTNNGSIEGDLVVNGMVTATKFMGDGSMLTNIQASAINGLVLKASSLVSPDGSIDPAVAVDNNGDVTVTEGDLTVNGMVTATKFMGDGSMLTNIQASAVNGTVASAQRADDATNALNAQLAQDALAAFSLKSPTDATAVSVDNNGNVAVEAGDLTVNGDVTADKFIGDGSMLTNVAASTATTAVNADNATTANFADQATNATNASNVTGGTITNSNITGGMINGSVLKNVTIPSGSNIMVSKLSSPDGTITAVNVDNNGTVFVNEQTVYDKDVRILDELYVENHITTDADMGVNGNVTADKFIGDGSMLTNVTAANATNALSAVNADNATTANFADQAGSVVGGNITNSTFNNSTLTGTTTVDGMLTFTNNGFIKDDVHIDGSLKVDSVVEANKFIGDGSMLTNVSANSSLNAVNADNATTANFADNAAQANNATNAVNATNASNVTGGTITNSNITGGMINGAVLKNVNIPAGSNIMVSKVSSPDGTIAALTADNAGDVEINEGDLTVNGTVTADKFIGDGSMLTNIAAGNIRGTVLSAQNASRANTANSASFATNASRVSGGTITNSSFTNGVINGATLVNVNIPGGSNIMVSKVSSPDGTIAALTADNAGDVEINEGDLTVNGTVTADKFIGDGSMLTNIAAGNITGTVANATNAVNAQNATNSTNVSGGEVENVTIKNVVVDGMVQFTANAFIKDDVQIDGDLTVDGTLEADLIDSTFTNGVINGATLVNVSIPGNPNINLSKLVAPDGSPNPAVSVDNDGNTTFSNDIDVKDGWINSERLTGTNLVSIMRNDLGPVGTSTNDGYRMYQVQRPEAGLPFQDAISDYVVFEKTDANHAPVDGGFAFLNTDKDDNTTISMIIEGDGQVGIGGIENPSEALEVNGNVKADKFIGDGSMLTNITAGNVVGKVASAANADVATNASNVSGGTITNSTIQNGVINGATLVNVSIPGGSNVMVSKVSSPNGAIPALTADNAGDIEIAFGNLVVNGTVIADKFIGDGSMLTNVSAGNITGTVANATNAVNADNATTANVADALATGATISNPTLIDPVVAGDINGVDEIDAKHIQTNTLDVADLANIEDLTVAGIAQFRDDVTLESTLLVKSTSKFDDDMEVNGTVTATKFIGDGSMLTNISGANVAGTVANATNAVNAQNLTGGVINGATLVNTIVSSLSAPDGDPNPAVSVDNAGKTTFAGDIAGMNIYLSKNLNAWNVTGRDYVKVGNDVIMGSGSRNYTFNNLKRPTGDLRVKGDNDDALLFTDASADSVGIGTATPSEKLEVNGNVLADNFMGANFTATGNISTAGSVTIGADLEVQGNVHIMQNTEIDGDLDVHDLHVADKLAIGHAMKLDPREDPPIGSAANLRGMIYYDNSEALCMHINGAWTKITGPGTCE
jgi:hypothetical protein